MRDRQLPSSAHAPQAGFRRLHQLTNRLSPLLQLRSQTRFVGRIGKAGGLDLAPRCFAALDLSAGCRIAGPAQPTRNAFVFAGLHQAFFAIHFVSCLLHTIDNQIQSRSNRTAITSNCKSIALHCDASTWDFKRNNLQKLAKGG